MIYRIPSSPVITTASEVYQINLTQREIQVLLLLYAGKTQNEIAAQLNLSRNTVRNHVQNMCSKVDANSTIGALQWYIDSVLTEQFGQCFVSIATLEA